MTLLCKIKYYHIVKQILIDLANVAACHPNHPLKLKIWFFAVHNDMAKLRSENYSPKEALPERNLKICDCHLGSFIKRQTSVHRVTTSGTTSDNEW